ncbi:DHA2 family efflux MFS transporter permease subunit [Thermodesulfobacteriota bacterium]
MNSPSTERYRWIVLGIIMVGTFMAILDASIVNVALPRMMSTFGANRDKIKWVSTGFMLASAVTMPIVGWLIGRVGHKAIYLGSIFLFVIGSAACALAWSYDALIGARVIQAVGAGAMQPVGMAMIANLFEPHERGKALGIWGTGVMVGPTLGPTVGGYLTDYFGWRTIFSINLPFGLLTFLAAALIMKSERYDKRTPFPFDWWGYLFLSIMLISGLLALSEGQAKGWNSTYIQTCFALSITGLILFLAVESSITHPLLDLSLFKYRNYSLCMILAVFRSVGLFGGLFLLPIFLQNLAGFTPIKAGLWMMPAGIVMSFMLPIAGRMADRYNPRWLVTMGTAVVGLSLLMYGNLDPLHGAVMIIGPQLIRSVGLAFMMAPLITTAINSVPLEKVAMASSFLNLSQRVSGSFGIALLNIFVTNAITEHSVRIGEHIGLRSETFHHFSLHIGRAMSWHSSGISTSDSGREQLISAILRHLPGLPSNESASGLILSLQTIMKRATVLGFDNGFVIGGLLVLAGIPISMMLKASSSDRRVPRTQAV